MISGFSINIFVVLLASCPEHYIMAPPWVLDFDCQCLIFVKSSPVLLCGSDYVRDDLAGVQPI